MIGNILGEKSSGWALRVLILVIWVLVGRVQEIIPGLSYLYLGKVVLGLAAIVYLFTPWLPGAAQFSYSQLRYLVYLFGLGLISTLQSFWPGGSFSFMMFGFLSPLFMVFLLLKVIVTYGELRKVFWSIMAFLLLLGGAALFFTEEGRISASATYDPNDLALIITIFFPLMYYFMINSQGGERLLLMGANLFLIVTMLATQSRSGFIAFCVVTILILIRERVNTGRILLGGIVVVMVFCFYAPTAFLERLQVVGSEDDYNMSAGGGRIEVWKRGLGLITEHPFLGVGPNAFPIAEGSKHIDQETGTTGKWSAAHNSYIQIASEFGIPGFILYMTVLITTIRSLRSAREKLPEESEFRWVINGLELSFYGFMTGGFFLSQAYSSALFLIIGLSVAVQILSQNSQPPEELTRCP